MNLLADASLSLCRQTRALLCILAACLVMAGCAAEVAEQPPEAALLSPVSFESLPGWRADRVSEALPALLLSCRRLEAVADDRPVGRQGVAGTAADWRTACRDLESLSQDDDAALRASLEAHFEPFEVSNGGDPSGLFTGYYEAELRGAMVPDDEFRWPLYRRPRDLVSVDLKRFRADLEGVRIIGRVEDGKLVPYRARAEIDDGALAGQDLEILWVDPVDAFFLHVQGSGRVALRDGSIVRLGFAASNGLPFTAIGRSLLDEGKVPRDQASMQGIRDWLRAHPDEAREVMQKNARYIFFRTISGDGPIGAQGVALTPGRSLAVDPQFMPLGAPVWLDTTWPGGDRPLQRLMVAQDTGGAIEGPVRGDFFWGFGEEALHWAGRMKQTGRYYLFLPKTVADRRRTAS